MSNRLLLFLLAAPLLFAQADLQGIWSNATITPLERPVDLADKQTLTAEEAAAYEKQMVDRNHVDHRSGNAEADVTLGYIDTRAWLREHATDGPEGRSLPERIQTPYTVRLSSR